METRANYVLVGLFTLGVVVAGFFFVYWFSQTGTGGQRVTYRVIFDGSVSGLRPGGSVLFNGIKAGEVVDLRLNPHDPKQVVTTIAVDKSVPVRSDTRVGLDFQGLTGIASLSLKGGRPDAPPLVAKPGEVPEIAADPAATADVMQTVRDVAGRAEMLLRRIDTLVADNDKSLRNTISSIEKFTEALGRNSERVDRIFAGLDGMIGGDDGKVMVKEITDAARSIRSTSENLDRRTAELSASLARFTGSGLREFEALAVDGRRTLGEIERAVKNFDRNPQRVIFGGGNSVPQYSGRR